MKRSLAALVCCLFFAMIVPAQQSAPPAQTSPDTPATKADIERYLEVTHSRNMMKQMMDIMSKQMRQLVHEQIEKNSGNLPPDYEAKLNKMTDDMIKNFPIEDMLEAMIPVYQKHWTKGDVDAMVAFYSTPTGQKLIKEMPTITAEAMQAAYPIMQKQMAQMADRVDEQVAQALKDSKAKSSPGTKTSPN